MTDGEASTLLEHIRWHFRESGLLDISCAIEIEKDTLALSDQELLEVYEKVMDKMPDVRTKSIRSCLKDNKFALSLKPPMTTGGESLAQKEQGRFIN